jgi:hypothetical protein
MIKVKIIELLNPPICTEAIPFFHSEAEPVERAMGKRPIIMDMLVISTVPSCCISRIEGRGLRQKWTNFGLKIQ